MKRYTFIIIIAGVVLVALLAVSGRAEKPPVEKAVVQFDEPVKLLNVTLKGEYLFVHDEEKMARTNDAIFMHCLPVRRNVIVTDGVIDSSASVVIDEAENRLHVQKAIMASLLGG